MKENIKLNVKQVWMVLGFLILVAGAMGILREVFFKNYEKQYHFWMSVLMGVLGVAVTTIFARYLARKK
jgi:uncharacterized membrane protein HdeD (DUF308 family)